MEMGATGTSNLQFFLMYNKVPGMYFLNMFLMSSLFCLAFGISSLEGNLSSQEFV